MADFTYDAKSGLFRYQRFGGFGLIVWKRVAEMSDADFSEHIDAVVAGVKVMGKGKVACINHSAQFSPNTKQRAIVNANKERMDTQHLRAMVILTPSPIIRGAIAAMGWVSRQDYAIKAYAPQRYEEAFRYCVGHTAFDEKAAVEAYKDALTALDA